MPARACHWPVLLATALLSVSELSALRADAPKEVKPRLAQLERTS